MLSSVIIEKWEKGKLYVETPQSRLFSPRIRSLGGAPVTELWAPYGRSWFVGTQYETEIRRLAKAIFGTDQQEYKPVTVTVDAYTVWQYDLQGSQRVLSFAGRDAITRPRNYVPIRLEAGIRIRQGEFPAIGGAIGNPNLGLASDSNIIIEIVDVPDGHVHLRNQIGIIDVKEQSHDEQNTCNDRTSSLVDDHYNLHQPY